jgi:GntR family transcriptional regulator/MocR family aminotransferase
MNRPAWELPFELSRTRNAEPLFLQIARAVSADVRRGRLRPGDALPGTRTLARTLGVHRNTVLAAWQELAAEGWIESAPRGATFVSRELPAPPRRFAATRTGLPSRAAFSLPDAPPYVDFAEHPPGTLSMAGGIPDVRLAPATELARAYRRALKRHAKTLLSYGSPRGQVRLRTALARMVSERRGLAASADDVVVTRGSQMGLDLAARALVRPGDVVAVEELGYRPAWEALRTAGAKLVPIPIDEQGMRVDLLPKNLRAVYVTPHHQFPTTVTLSAARRLELLALAERHGFAILEDDYDHEFHYEGRPVLPLASADRAGSVVYIATLSKVLAPGLRIGYVVAPRPVLDRIVAHRLYVDRQGDQTVEHAVAELLEDGAVQRHVHRTRRIYQARRDVLVRALRTRFADVLEFSPSQGGIAIWAQAHCDVEAWAERALAHRLMIQTGKRFAFDGRARDFVRLGFAGLDAAEMKEALRRLEASASECSRRKSA